MCPLSRRLSPSPALRERVAPELAQGPGEGILLRGRERASLGAMLRPDISDEHRRFAKRLRRNQSELEQLLWRELRANRLSGWRFKRQVPVAGYVLDFVCMTRRLVVEADGPVHDDPEQKHRDAARDAALRKHGFRVLRFSGDRIRSDLASVLAEIRGTLADPDSTP